MLALMLKAGCLCGRADGSCLPMCAISPLGMALAKPLTLACSSPSSVVAQPLPGNHLLMHHESPGASIPRSPSPCRRPATSLSERYSLRIPKREEDSEVRRKRRRRSWDEAAGVAVPGKSVTLSRQASQTAARRASGGEGGEGRRIGGGERVKSEGGVLLVPGKSFTLSSQEKCLVDKRRAGSNSQLVSLSTIANKQQVPSNTEKVFPNAPVNSKPVKRAKTVNSQDFNQRSNSLKHQRNYSLTVGSNSNVSEQRFQPRSASLREAKPSQRFLTRNQSLQSKSKNPGPAHSSLEPSLRSNPSLSKLTSSETGSSTFPTGWRF